MGIKYICETGMKVARYIAILGQSYPEKDDIRSLLDFRRHMIPFSANFLICSAKFKLRIYWKFKVTGQNFQIKVPTVRHIHVYLATLLSAADEHPSSYRDLIMLTTNQCASYLSSYRAAYS